MAVFSVGITLSSVKVSINWQAILGSILKRIVMPGLGLIVALLSNMDADNLQMFVVVCTLPPAFSGIIIADEYNTCVSTGTFYIGEVPSDERVMSITPKVVK